MLLSTGGRNAAVGGVTAVGLFASLHTAWPGDTGTSEVAGGTPAYARRAVVWGAPAGGSAAGTVALAHDVPAATTVRFVGLWSLATAGTFYGASPLGGTAPEPFTAQDAGDVLFCNNHGYVADQTVIVVTTGAEALPTGLVEGTTYYVRSPTTDTFQLAATAGGAAIALTSDGAGFVTPIIPEAFGSQGQLQVSSETLAANA